MSPGPSLAEVLDALPDGVALLEASGRIASANRAMGGLFGTTVVGRTVLELTRNADAGDAALAALAGKPGHFELVLPASRRTLLVHFAPLAGGALLCARDVTEAKRMELARRDFVANASHELRTPVSAIYAAAETLLGGAVDEAAHARGFVEMIARHAERLSRLTEELLDLSRIESGEWDLRLEVLDASAVIQAALELFKVRAANKGVALANRIGVGTSIRADRRALEQVVVNLLDNAVKHTPAGGAVTVEAERARAAVTLCVKDTGPGIERHHLGRLFERFYRADQGRARDAGGTGLGLAIVKHLVQVQGGEVGVESDRDGSRFWVRLPAG